MSEYKGEYEENKIIAEIDEYPENFVGWGWAAGSVITKISERVVENSEVIAKCDLCELNEVIVR
jgi:hypothetical protein